MAVLGLRFCARAFSSCGKRGPLFIAVRGPLTIAASLVVEHRLQERRLSSRGSRAQLLRGTWDLPRPGPKPVSPALAGRLSTTAPPGKPCSCLFTERNCGSRSNSKSTLSFLPIPNFPYSFQKAYRYCINSSLRKQKFSLQELAFFLCAFEM